MLYAAIASCTVFLVVLISSYWWGGDSKFSLGSRLADAKDNMQRGRAVARSNSKGLEFDYVFERNRNNRNYESGIAKQTAALSVAPKKSAPKRALNSDSAVLDMKDYSVKKKSSTSARA